MVHQENISFLLSYSQYVCILITVGRFCFYRPLLAVRSLLLGLEEVTRLRLVNIRISDTLLPKMEIIFKSLDSTLKYKKRGSFAL